MEGDTLTPRENFMLIFEGKQPERYCDIRESMALIPDPVKNADRVPQDGKEHKDSWGTVNVWLPGSPGKHPHVTPENAVIKDITKWKEQLVIPPVTGLDWTATEDLVNAVDRSQKFVYFMSAQGLFERSHFLMGMEDAFCAYLEEPEAMYEMLSAIADFKIAAIKEAAVHMHPDVVFFQDDWGNKLSLFLPPSVWRDIIKPLHTKIVEAAHEIGAYYFHHADCVCDVIAEDMVEMGVDLWQGVIPQNDIVDVQRRTEGKLAIAGGIDAALVDVESTTDEQVRAEVRRAIDTYCPGRHYFPQATPDPFIKRISIALQDELLNYGKTWAQEHPIE